MEIIRDGITKTVMATARKNGYSITQAAGSPNRQVTLHIVHYVELKEAV